MGPFEEIDAIIEYEVETSGIRDVELEGATAKLDLHASVYSLNVLGRIYIYLCMF